MSRPKDPQGRSWFVTIWNPSQVSRALALPARALVVGRELCPDSGREHWHIYARFETNKRFSWWRSNFPDERLPDDSLKYVATNDFQLREGTEAQARAYILKPDTQILVDRGCQTDTETSGDVTEHVLDLLEAGAPDFEIYRKHRKFFFHHHAKIDAVKRKMSDWSTQGYQFKKIKTEPAQSDPTPAPDSPESSRTPSSQSPPLEETTCSSPGTTRATDSHP